jgi:hypothetical protein
VLPVFSILAIALCVMASKILKDYVSESCCCIRLNRLHWFGHEQRMEENRIPKIVFYMNLETTGLRGNPRNRWHDEVMEDRRIVGGKA